MNWTTPTGTIYNFYNGLLNNNHILIAGSSGSGKSVLTNGLIYTMLHYAPSEKQIILIDLKQVELYEFRNLPHTIGYADNITDTERLLDYSVNLMRQRYDITRMQGLRKYSGSDIYIILDEYADIKFNGNKQIDKCISLLSTMGRAAGIHLIICTQRATRDILTPLIKTNSDVKICLRTDTKQESINIINSADGYLLPKFGQAIVKLPGKRNLNLQDIPMILDTEINQLINYWMQQVIPPVPPKDGLFRRLRKAINYMTSI